MSFNVGENVGPYRIVQQLGQGGMATVYKAFHAALDRYVAIKALHPALGEDANFEARFQREARLVAKLDHPHIVPIYDFAEHEGRPYLVMKFIEGDTLKARLQKGPLTSAEIKNVVDSVGSALAYAHKQGILHRDIKPSNVLIGVDGEMWLADFGLARIAQAPESTLSSDMIMGTPQYISPEQAMGEKQLDEGTDIYSFGVMLYEMVVGQVPFNADTPFSIIHDHIYSPLPMPRVINPRVPEPVERVLLKALAKDRAARFANVDAFVEAFENAWTEAGVPMQGTAITMRPASLRAAATTIAPGTPGSVGVPPSGSETAVAAPGSAASSSTSISAAPAGVPAIQPAPRAQRIAPWLLAAGGAVVVVCIALAAFGALRFLRGRQLNIGVPTTASTSTPVSLASAAVQPDVTATLAVTPTETAVPAVATALQASQQNPGDPQALLNLSLAYWDAQMPHISLMTLSKAADLAGPTDTQFLENAGGEFQRRQAWIPATAMYARAIKSLGPGAQPSTQLITDFHECLYHAAQRPDVSSYLSWGDLSVIEQPITMVAQARHLYYNGDTQQAHSILNQVRTLKPGMPEASLLEAEMDSNEGKTFDAKQILNILLADLNTPNWVRQEAQTLINKIP
jgi:serine/threonine protein kinase